MKKILSFLTILLTVSVVFAADAPSGSLGMAVVTGRVDSSTPVTDTQAYVKVGFSIGTSEEDGNGEKVVVGFKKSELGDTASDVVAEIEDAIKDDTYIKMDLNTASATASLSDSTPVYAFWQIQSGQHLKVSLETSGALAGRGDSIGWTVNNFEKETTIVSSANNEETRFIHEHDGSVMGSAGSIRLGIVTNNYALKPVGTYSGYLYIKVAAV